MFQTDACDQTIHPTGGLTRSAQPGGHQTNKALTKIIFIFSLHKETRKPGENPMQHSPLLASWLPYRKRCGEIL